MPRLMRSTLLCCGLSVAIAAVVVTTWARGDDPAAPGEPLLPLPDRAPAGLDLSAFEPLGPNWETWSETASESVRRLYEESPDAASQAQTLAEVRKVLKVVEKALADSKYQMIRGPLLDLQGKLARRLEVYDAVAGLLAGPRPTLDAGAPSPLVELKDAVNSLETSLLVIPQGATWLPFIRSEELLAIAESGSVDDESRAVLADVLARLSPTAQLSDKQKSFLQQPMFTRLVKALDRAVVLMVDEPEDAWRTRVREAATTLLASLEEYEGTSSRAAAASARQAFEELLALGGKSADPLAAVLRTHYFNYNLNIAASEGFLSRFVSERRSEAGRVNERVDDVQVSGCQWTNTKVGINLKPGANVTRFDLTLDGDVRSRTTGEVSNATVYNTGWACFRAEKEVQFDGEHFVLQPARVGVNASNTTYDAETCLEWLPVARSIARSIALSKAEDKKPQADAYTRNKISGEVRGRFDRETREQFGEAEQNVRTDLIDPLHEVEMYPELLRMSSTEEDAIVRGRLMREGELGGTRPPKTTSPGKGVLVQIHQSLLSNGADRMDFHGQKLTQAQVDEKIDSTLKKVLPKREIKRENPPKDDGTLLVFDTVDPISFQIEDGQVILSMRAGLERPGEEDIPTQIISVPLKLELQGDQIVMTRGSVGVRPVVPPANRGQQIVRAQIMRGRIQDTIPEQKVREASMQIEQQGRSITAHVRSLQAEDGWLTLTAE